MIPAPKLKEHGTEERWPDTSLDCWLAGRRPESSERRTAQQQTQQLNVLIRQLWVRWSLFRIFHTHTFQLCHAHWSQTVIAADWFELELELDYRQFPGSTESLNGLQQTSQLMNCPTGYADEERRLVRRHIHWLLLIFVMLSVMGPTHSWLTA